jgi:hypothetical protein
VQREEDDYMTERKARTVRQTAEPGAREAWERRGDLYQSASDITDRKVRWIL